MITDTSVSGVDDKSFEAACEAFRLGPPGVLRHVQQVDSYPGEPDDKSEAYKPLSTTIREERRALADAINAYEEARSELERDGWYPPGKHPDVRLRPSRGHTWTRITIDYVAARGFDVYQDRVETFEVTFEGGTPSATDGWEMCFGVPRPFDESFWTANRVSLPPKTIEERRIAHYTNIKRRFKQQLPGGGWDVDLTAGEPNLMGAKVLLSFDFLVDESTSFSSKWRLVIRTPNMS